MATKLVPKAEFERALLDVLVMDYDLRVRMEGDRVERRRSDYATLLFDYPEPGDDLTKTKVIVRIEEMTGFSCIFHADLSSYDAVSRSAEECESLALGIIEVTEALNLRTAERQTRRGSPLPLRRRAED